MTETIYQGETYRLRINIKDAVGERVPLAGVAAEGRMSVGGVAVTYPAEVDGQGGAVILVVDRDVTTDWPEGPVVMRYWLDHGEGAEIEADMIYEHRFQVKAAP